MPMDHESANHTAFELILGSVIWYICELASYIGRVFFTSWRNTAMFSRRAGRKPYVLSLLPLSIIVVGLVILSLSFTVHSAQAASAAPRVDVMQLNTEIDPASLRYLTHSINTAENDGARALVVEIDTPGGDIESMNSMYQAELNST